MCLLLLYILTISYLYHTEKGKKRKNTGCVQNKHHLYPLKEWLCCFNWMYFSHQEKTICKCSEIQKVHYNICKKISPYFLGLFLGLLSFLMFKKSKLSIMNYSSIMKMSYSDISIPQNKPAQKWLFYVINLNINIWTL